MYTGIKFTNNASTQTVKSVSSVDTTITVAENEAAIFPRLESGDYFLLTLMDINGQHEIVKCTSRTDSVFTVVRAQENTTAHSFPIGSLVELRLTADSITRVAEDASTTKVHATIDAQSVGAASGLVFGHVRLADSITNEEQALSSTACTPKALADVVARLTNAATTTLLTTSGTWVAPESATYTITTVGGGGPGGSGGSGSGGPGGIAGVSGGGSGGGGGAGQVITTHVRIEKGTAVPYTIGGSGGKTTFGEYTSALGGGAGGNGGAGWYDYTYTQSCGYGESGYVCEGTPVLNTHGGSAGVAGASYGSLATAGAVGGTVYNSWDWAYGARTVGIGGVSMEGTFGNGGNGGIGGDGCIQYLNAQNVWGTPGAAGSAGTQGCIKITVKLV